MTDHFGTHTPGSPHRLRDPEHATRMADVGHLMPPKSTKRAKIIRQIAGSVIVFMGCLVSQAVSGDISIGRWCAIAYPVIFFTTLGALIAWPPAKSK